MQGTEPFGVPEGAQEGGSGVIRTILRDAAIGIGGAYAALCIVVIVGSAIGDLFGKDWDRRDGDGR